MDNKSFDLLTKIGSMPEREQQRLFDALGLAKDGPQDTEGLFSKVVQSVGLGREAHNAKPT